MLQLGFEAKVIYWRGPAPFFFAPLPPVEATINGETFTTAMFRRDATYYLPLKDVVRRKCGVTADDVIAVEMTVGQPKR